MKAKAVGYIKKEKCFSIENIAHDWELDENLKSAITNLHKATYERPTYYVEAAQKCIKERLQELKEISMKQAANENSTNSKKGKMK